MLLKIADAARILNVEPSTVYSYVERGMPHIRLSPRCIRFEEQDVKAWIAKCRSQKTNVGDTMSSSCREADAFTAFAHRTRPRPKRSNGKQSSERKSSELTNLVEFPNTASNKR